MSIITTPRLLLRNWRDEDRVPYAALNADLRVRRYFSSTLTREQSDRQIDGFRDHIAEHGFGFWALEVPNVADCIGFVGLARCSFPAPFTPCVEIGWRLAAEHWGKGYASEAARATLAYGFGPLGLDEIVALAVPANVKSTAVMERIGMTRSAADDFEHPAIAAGDPLRLHVLYRARAADLQLSR